MSSGGLRRSLVAATWMEEKNKWREGRTLLICNEGVVNQNVNCRVKAKIKFTTNTYFNTGNAQGIFLSGN